MGTRISVRAGQLRLGDIFVWNSGTSLPVVRAEVVCIEPERDNIRVTTERIDNGHKRGMVRYTYEDVLQVERESP